MTSGQRRRQLATMAAYFWPQGPCSNSSSAVAAASALWGRVNRPERLGERLALLPGSELHRVADQMDDAGRHHTVREGGGDRLGEALPFRPSTTAISTSLTPRALRSFMTLSQNLAPSGCSSHRPSTSFSPSQLMPMARYTVLLRN